jgi:hypothetical protein
MGKGSPWPDEHLELLRQAVLEKQMPVNALCKLFPGRTPSSIRCQLIRQQLPTIPDNQCIPDLDFFASYGAGSPSLKVV